MARPTNPDRGRLELAASPEQLRRWEAAARAQDLSLSQWVRRVCDGAARRKRARRLPGTGESDE